MKKSISIFFFLFMASLVGQAQHFELGVLAGGSNYMGDLSRNSTRLFLKETHLAGGVFFGYQINDYFSTKLGFNYAKVSGNDFNGTASGSELDTRLRLRNLDFHSEIYELTLRGEWNIMGFQPYNFSRRFSPFLFAGVGGFKFNPKTRIGGSGAIQDLQPLGTEGQGMSGFGEKYKLLQLSIPMGIGVKYLLSENWTLGFEVGARFAFTDYIDDVGGTYVSYDELLTGNGVLAAELSHRGGEAHNIGGEPIIQVTGSQRGDNRSNDWYFIAGITISYNFIDNGMLGKRRRIRRRKSGCPTD